jgi:ubiquinone/menaquinone biosynthesis C-methylase UbiE
MKAHASIAAAPEDDAPFPSVAPRNALQEFIELPLMLRVLAVPAGGAVLEIGCGRGIALPVLSATLRPSSITGVDVDATALADAESNARARGAAVRLHHADVRTLPFADASFDLVFDFGTCYHIANSAQALREIARVLKPGGWFVTETVVSQLFAHPLRTRGRPLPWRAVPELRLSRHAGLWQMRRKAGPRRVVAGRTRAATVES